MDARRSTLLWIRSRLLPAAVAHRVVVAAVEAVEVPARVAAVALEPFRLPEQEVEAELLQELQRFQAQRRLLLRRDKLRVAAAAHKPAAEVAVVRAAAVDVAVADWPQRVIDRVRPFPAWKLSMHCLPQARIRTRHSARVVRKPVQAADLPIPC